MNTIKTVLTTNMLTIKSNWTQFAKNSARMMVVSTVFIVFMVSRQLPCTLVSPKGRRSNCKSICINYLLFSILLLLSHTPRICVVVSIQDVYRVLLLNVQYIKQISTFFIKPKSCQLPVPGMRIVSY
jgi:hypothetical protein